MQDGLYAEHVRVRRERAAVALSETGFDRLILSSGTPMRYYADDMDAPHHVTPHFAHWLPLEGPHHLLVVEPGKRPRLLRHAPEDYWYEQAPLGNPFWLEEFELEEFGSVDDAWHEAQAGSNGASAQMRPAAYVGDAPELAQAHGVAADGLNPPELVARLDWDRSYKTPYEVSCIRAATQTAARGHRAAHSAFDSGASELEIHRVYIEAVGCVDKELPYESIVGIDSKGAILHYHGKTTRREGMVLLIDAGARHNGYCSDITRTWTRQGCDERFAELIQGLDALQRSLCDQVHPGGRYPDLHHLAHIGIADLLHEQGILRRGGEGAVADGLTRPFFPHGLGHFLGIQVHDVGGHQAGPAGGQNPPPKQHPYLRTTRTIEAGQVFTIEPGIYFIEMLLRKLRKGSSSGDVNWDRVEKLAPHGGVRIEDNVVVTSDGHENLTRQEL